MKRLILALTVLGTLTFAPAGVFAQQPVDVFKDVCDSQARNSSVCEDVKPKGNPIFGPQGIITSIANILTILVGVAAIIGIIVAAVKMITNSNNPQEVSQARDLIIYAIVGLVLAALAQALVRLVLNKVFQ